MGPVWEPFLTEPNKMFRVQRGLCSKSSSVLVPCVLWYLCARVVCVSPGIGTGDLGMKTWPCIWIGDMSEQMLATQCDQCHGGHKADPWPSHASQSGNLEERTAKLTAALG